MNAYKITILNFDKHNPNRKASFKKILLANNFFYDTKISQLSTTSKLLFIFLITQCGDQGTSTVALTDRQISYIIGSGQRPRSLLSELQSYQLVTVEFPPSSRIEENRIEENIKKGISAEVEIEVRTMPDGQTEFIEKLPQISIPVRLNKVQSRGCIPEFGYDEVCFRRLEFVTEKAQRAWLDAYPSVDFIVTEIRRAHAWIETNPKKAPKDFGKFMLNWLSRGYETYRKGIQSKPAGQLDRVSQGNRDVLRQLHEEGL